MQLRPYFGDDYPMIGFWGDDNRPRTKSWDARLVETLSELGTGITYGNDLIQQEKMPTAVAMTSDIPRTLDYMAIPGPVHLCLDLGWLEWGRGIDRIRYLPDVVIEHLHPTVGTALTDAVYRDCNSPARNAYDREAFYTYRDGRLKSDLAKLRKLTKGL